MASACCPACGGCGSRCRGPGSLTATRGRSPPDRASCWSTRGCTSPARWPSSSGPWTRSTCASSTCGYSPAPTPTPTTGARRPRSCERAGCELWLHPNHAHATRWRQRSGGRPGAAAGGGTPERGVARGAGRIRRAGQALPLRRGQGGRARPYAGGRGDAETDLGEWTVYETPGHAPSHVCLYQPERRILISGDHVLGRISLFYDYGYTADPVGEFLRSLDKVDVLDARLALSGHGKPFVDVHGHIEGNRTLVAERLAAVHGSVSSAPEDRAGGASRRLQPAGRRPQRHVVSLRDPQLPAPPGGAGARPRRARRRRRALARDVRTHARSQP